MRTITFERFKQLCHEAEVIEIGDDRVTDSEVADTYVMLETEASEPGLITESEFNRGCFPAGVDDAGWVQVKDLEDNDCEIIFYSTKVIEP